MPSTISRFVAASVLAISAGYVPQLVAQETSVPEGQRVGIGVALTSTTVFIDDFGLLSLDVNSLLVPIRTTGGIMFEPEIGFVRFASSSADFESSFTTTRLGAGVLFPLTARDRLHPYLGPRIAVVRATETSESSFSGRSTEKNTGWQFGMAVGAHYWISDHLTLGGEGLLSRLGFGKPDRDPPSGGPEPTSSFTTLSGAAILRLFF